jgi:nicotinate dehydrogenase subunit A
MPLLYALRNDLQLNGPKFGCGLAQCGAMQKNIGEVRETGTFS